MLQGYTKKSIIISSPLLAAWSESAGSIECGREACRERGMDMVECIMYWALAFALWLAGLFIGRFNACNNIIAEVTPENARIGWLPGRHLAPAVGKFLAFALFISSVVLLYFTGTIDFHWVIVIASAIVLTFISSVLVSTLAWIAFARKYPDMYLGGVSK